MPSREELIKQAEQKYQREQLIAQAQEKWLKESEPPPELSFGQKSAQALRSGMEGLTFGLSEPVVSGLMAAEQNIKKAAQESKGLSEFVKKAINPERIKSEYEADVQRRRSFEAENPILAMSSEMAGAIVPAALSGGSSAIARGMQVLPEAFTAGGQAISKGLSKLPLVSSALESKGVIGSAARIGEQALVSGAQAAGAEALKRSVQEPSGFIKKEDNLPGIAESAVFGAKFGGMIAGLPEIA